MSDHGRISIFAYFLFSIPISVFSQRAKPGDFPWRIRIILDNDTDSFQGSLKFNIYPDPKSNQPRILSINGQIFGPGFVLTSLVKLNETGISNDIARIELTANLDSDQNCTSKTLSIKDVSFTSFHKRRTYRKRFDDSQPGRVQAQCRNVTNASVTVIENVQSNVSGDCYYKGEFYESGGSFEIGCDMQCLCRGGMVECDSMCKPIASPLPRNCRRASVDRKCCDETECMEDAVWDSCPVHTAQRDKMPPWTVLITIAQKKNETDTKKTCGASIIHKKLLLTSAYCVKWDTIVPTSTVSPSSIFISQSISSSISIARAVSVHIHPAYTGKDGSADLALIELAEDGLEFGETLRRVNLPWPTLCTRYVRPGCSLQYTTVHDPNAYLARAVSTYKYCPGSTPNSTPAQSFRFTKSQTKNGTEPVYCIQRMNDGLTGENNVRSNLERSLSKCNEETGNGVVTKRAQYNYIVGVTTHQYSTTGPSQQSKSGASVEGPIVARSKREDGRSCQPQYAPVTNLCPHIDWLKTTINTIL